MATLMELMASEKRTENGAFARNTTFNAIVNLFAVAGALRNRNSDDIIEMWKDAFNEDAEIAFKMLFYIRNIRGGLGERNTFRVLLKYVATNYPDFVMANLDNIVFYGRYDDLFVLLDTPIENYVYEYIKEQLVTDSNADENEPISLLAKWMPSINTSSDKTRQLAYKFCNALNYSPAEYRKLLSRLRKKLDVLEVNMSANNWSNINYSSVPALAMNKSSNAFYNRDHDRFIKYIEDVKNGKTTINSGTLYPYDLVHKIFNNENEVAEQQWKNMPDYFNGRTFNALVMADVSGSMLGRPIETSIGLAIYFAEHNTGVFANSYLTFTSTPNIVTIKPNKSLYEKVNCVKLKGIGYDTNLESAFNRVLDTAICNNVPKEDMPESIIVISDMEINDFGQNTSFLSYMKTKFNDAGYELPKLVWWNVNARSNTFHADTDDNTQFISGSSASAFESLISGKTLSAIELVVNTLKDYDRVIIPEQY